MFSRLKSNVRGLHGDSSGAILLLSLASLLIIMMLALVIIDAGKSARDKVELQAAADTAAFSHASVKSRSMNMIAYTNVAKRSITGILSTYLGMYLGFRAYVSILSSRCNPPWTPIACIVAAANRLLLRIETLTDTAFFFAEIINGLFTDYHRDDLSAIDNYQQYLMWLSPWWAYSESVTRGMRNGATTVASFPPPMGTISGIGSILGTITSLLPSTFTATAGVFDRFPVERMDWWGSDSFFSHTRDPSFVAEQLANSYHHKNRSTNWWPFKAGSGTAWALGVGMFGAGYAIVTFLLHDEAKPFAFRRMGEGAWLSETSSLVLAYGVRPDKFGSERDKYEFLQGEYSPGLLTGPAGIGYEPSGYWSMARSEMSYQEEELSPFKPSWTARLRPVALRGEWQGAGYDLNQAYHSVLPFLALTSIVGAGGGIGGVAQDFVNMERMTRSFGHSTIEGIAK